MASLTQPLSQSIWLANAGSDDLAVPTPPSRADVVVVGAGVCGMTTATMLAEAGAQVCVLDTRPIAHGATGHSSAKVSVLHELTAARIARRRGERVAGRYIEANLFGFDWIARQVAEHDIGCDWQNRTAVTYTTQGRQYDKMRLEADLYAAGGVTTRVVDALDLPFEISQAVTVADQAQFDPVAFIRGLAERFVSLGGTIATGVRVSGVCGTDPVELTTSHGAIAAGRVVVTTGLPFLDRGLLFARAEPESSYVLACRVEAEHPSGMYLSADGPKRSLRTAEYAGAEVLLVGGESHKTGQGGDTEKRYETLAQWTDEHFGLRSIEARFMTQDFMTPDHVPFAGPLLPWSDEILVATGMNKWGFTNGVAAAAVNTANILEEAPPAWADAFSTRRLPLAGIDQIAKANTDVAIHMVGGWTDALRRTNDTDPAPGRGRAARSGFDIVASSTTEDAEPCRVSGVCPHLGGILAWNPAEQTWDCPLHGSRFERDGVLLHGPAVDDLEQQDS